MLLVVAAAGAVLLVAGTVHTIVTAGWGEVPWEGVVWLLPLFWAVSTTHLAISRNSD